MNWSDVVGDEESDDYDSDDEEEDHSSESLSESFMSSLSMSIESHSLSSPQFEKEKEGARQRKLSLSLVYEDGAMETQETHAFESNPLSYNDDSDDKDFQKLSFTRMRKMSDAGGWFCVCYYTLGSQRFSVRPASLFKSCLLIPKRLF